MTKVNQILNSGFVGAISVTGGGCGVIGRLLENGGGSKFLKFAFVPYSRASLNDFLSDLTLRSVCEETVNQMSAVTYHSVLLYDNDEDQDKVLGIACSAKLISDGEREGREHKAYVGIHSLSRREIYEFSPSSKTRIEQERELEDFIINCILGFING